MEIVMKTQAYCAASFVIAAVPFGAGAGASPRNPQAASVIQHVIIIMQENRSVDRRPTSAEERIQHQDHQAHQDHQGKEGRI
jgi:hypothetical protein